MITAAFDLDAVPEVADGKALRIPGV